MEKNVSNLSNKFMLIEFILCASIIFFNLCARHEIVSVIFMFSFILLAMFFLYITGKKDKEYDLYGCTFSILAVSGLCVLFNSFSTTAEIDFENLKNYIMFCSTIVFMFIMLNIDIDKKVAEKILILNIFISILYPVGYNIFPQQSRFADVALNFSNPNLTGMWILQSLLYLSLAFFVLNNRFYRTMSVICFAINIYMLDLTGARNCLIALFLYGIVCLIIFVKQYVSFSKWIIAAINISPICFVFLYLSFIDRIVASGVFDFLIGEGKTLTSRVAIWINCLNKIDGKWLIGSYYTAGGNAHNSHLVILCSFGVLTLLLTIYFTHKLCCILSERCKSKASLYCLAAFFAVVFMGLGEGALYVGAMGIYIMASGFIYISRAYSIEDDNNIG